MRQYCSALENSLTHSTRDLNVDENKLIHYAKRLIY